MQFLSIIILGLPFATVPRARIQHTRARVHTVDPFRVYFHEFYEYSSKPKGLRDMSRTGGAPLSRRVSILARYAQTLKVRLASGIRSRDLSSISFAAGKFEGTRRMDFRF